MDFYLIVSSTPYQEALFNDMTKLTWTPNVLNFITYDKL